MKRANSGLTWIRQKHVTQFLQALATTPTVTHAAVDACRLHARASSSAACSSNMTLSPSGTSTELATRSGPETHSIGSQIPSTAM